MRIPVQLIAYDITEDKVRVRVAKILLDYGVRVQYSVFEMDMTENELTIVLKRVRAQINEDTDSVLVYNLCAGCDKRVISLGVSKKYTVPDVIAI